MCTIVNCLLYLVNTIFSSSVNGVLGFSFTGFGFYAFDVDLSLAGSKSATGFETASFVVFRFTGPKIGDGSYVALNGTALKSPLASCPVLSAEAFLCGGRRRSTLPTPGRLDRAAAAVARAPVEAKRTNWSIGLFIRRHLVDMVSPDKGEGGRGKS
jgi:hypothetical protein